MKKGKRKEKNVMHTMGWAQKKKKTWKQIWMDPIDKNKFAYEKEKKECEGWDYQQLNCWSERVDDSVTLVTEV